MSDLTDSHIIELTKKSGSNESVSLKTVRLTINLITHILMGLTVFVSIVFACISEKITWYELHIIFCVLGYQLFMSQGTLVLSKYNSWSMYLSRRDKKRLHIVLQLLGFILVVVGSGLIMCNTQIHFNTAHGTLGVVALIISLISIINGYLANYAYKLNSSCIPLIKFVHYTSGILTLLVAAGGLSTGFDIYSFRIWVNDDAVTGLIFITCLFTLLVALDFWISSRQRLRNLV